MAKYKILLLFPSLEDIGGVATFCRLLFKNLSSDFEIDHFQIGNRPGNKGLIKQLSFFLKDARGLKKKLIKNRYNLIHLNPSFRVLALPRDSFYLSRINKFCGENTLVMFHGWDEGLAERIKRNPIFRKLFRRIYEKVKLILVLCQPFREQLEKIGIPSEKIKVITTMYQEEHNAGGYPQKKANDEVNILFMARLIKSKGPYIAAEVGKLLVENGYKNFHFVFAGEGPEYEGLKRYINEHRLTDYIQAPGTISGEQKRAILEASDIFLFPSRSEGCPIAVLEAMDAGMAVVSTPVGAIPEVVKKGENGFLVDSQEPRAFYEAVTRLIENREMLKRIQKNNRKKAKENYEAKVVTKKIESLYLSIIHD